MGSIAAIRSARQSLPLLRAHTRLSSSWQRFSSSGRRASSSEALPFSVWHRLLSSGQRDCSINLQYERCRTAQVVKFSSAAAPVSEKDSSHDSSAEESGALGDEKVEPVIEAKEQAAPQENTKEENPKATEENQKKEDKDALLKSIAELEASISEKQSLLLELKERATTTKAELESVRIRSQKEADNTKKYAIQEFAKPLLDFADNLGRALATIPANVRKELMTDKSESGKQLKTMVERLVVIERELMKVLKKFGVQKFEPVGQPFDPNSHLALFEVSDPSKDAGTIAMVAKVGYMLHDRVLRPAEVGIVKSPE